MENRISIPKPCHENWDDMLPEEQGRHCLSCCKTVIDFSAWDHESIVAYLQNKNGERVCGRFNAGQVAQSVAPGQETWMQEVLHSSMPLLRKIAAMIVLCFGLLSPDESHAQKRMGKVAMPKEHTTSYTKGEAVAIPATADTTKQLPKTDTLKPQPQIMGMIAPVHLSKEKPVKKAKNSEPGQKVLLKKR